MFCDPIDRRSPFGAPFRSKKAEEARQYWILPLACRGAVLGRYVAYATLIAARSFCAKPLSPAQLKTNAPLTVARA